MSVGKVLALRLLEVAIEGDVEAYATAQVDAIFDWAHEADRMLSAAGVTGRRTVNLTARPSEEMLALLASGRAFTIEADPPLPQNCPPQIDAAGAPAPGKE
jgi:hypothetical protein